MNVYNQTKLNFLIYEKMISILLRTHTLNSDCQKSEFGSYNIKISLLDNRCNYEHI